MFVGDELLIRFTKETKMEILVTSSLNHNQMLQFLSNFSTYKSL